MQARRRNQLCGWHLAIATVILLPSWGWAKTVKWDTPTDWAKGTASKITWQVTPGQLELIFDPNSVKKTPFIYLPNSGRDTVVQMDTRNGLINWTYNLKTLGLPGNPSRTTVDTNGNVWIGLRDGSKVVALSQQGTYITNVEVGSGPRAVTIDQDGNIWAGGYNSTSITKISGKTFQILQVVRDPKICTYGATTDSIGNIWTLNRCQGTITKINAKTGAIVGHYGAYGGYGIAADRQGYVWVGSYEGQAAYQYRASDGVLVKSYPLGARGRGVGIDAQNRAWVACSHTSSGGTARQINRIDPATGQNLKFNNVGLHTIGIAIDSSGFVWANSYDEGKAYKLRVSDGGFVATYDVCDVTGTRPCANTGCTACTNTNQAQPYTYSDMTGFQLQLSPADGTWSVIYDATCKASFQSVSWNGLLPADTTATVRARSAATQAGLASASWGPYVAKGASLNVPPNRYVEIQFFMTTKDSRTSPTITDATLTFDHFAEVCDGQDNDCNGQIDDTFGNLGQTCTNGKGICAAQGKFVCNSNGSGTICDATPGTPQTEICDGLDNNCDGQVDETFPQQGSACGVGLGACLNTGVLICQNGKITCSVSPKAPSPEVCDNIDNDCDGQVDEQLFLPCKTICGSGRQQCVNGKYGKCDAPEPQTEICDGLDNDCDGLVDQGVERTCKTACGEGTERCVNGKFDFCTAVKPTPEVCDGKDNDCNGQIDDKIPDRKCQGACGQGTATCSGGKWSGCSGPQPEVEVCDGKDNDCDGKADGFTEECKNTCGSGRRLCQNGQWLECNAPQPQPEVCDGKDNDCDGKIDKLANCPTGSICLEGTCRLKCRGGECPGGAACVEELCEGDLCAKVKCEAGRTCMAGRCVAPCDLITCPKDYACDAGKCVKDDCYRNGCPTKERCVRGVCEANPCLGVSCSSNQFCRDGQCVDSCANVTCQANQKCIDGKCKDDPKQTGPCQDVKCAPAQTCKDGKCTSDLCNNVKCPQGKLCLEGVCDHDPCENIKCPTKQKCEDAQCVKDDTPTEPTADQSGTPDGGSTSDTSTNEATASDTSTPDGKANTDNANPESKTGGTQNKPDDPASERYAPGCGCSLTNTGSLPASFLLLLLFAFIGIRQRKSNK